MSGAGTNGHTIVGLGYVTLYVGDLAAATAFYARVFGPPPEIDEKNRLVGWRMGSTWLTLFDSSVGPARGEDPRNCEFAIQVATRDDVDSLHAALVAAGATSFMAPRDTKMYEPMRFCCVDDPFGARIDVYCAVAR